MTETRTVPTPESPVIEVKRRSLVLPTENTRFHIDFNWWKQNDRDWRVYLMNYLCEEHQEAFSNSDLNIQVDWIDPETAEVQRVDGLQNILINHCAKEPEFITRQTALVDAVFRIFLANGNTPLTAVELGEILGRPWLTILRTLSGLQVHKGLRPSLD